jgi:hypothetical protein
MADGRRCVKGLGRLMGPCGPQTFQRPEVLLELNGILLEAEVAHLRETGKEGD